MSFMRIYDNKETRKHFNIIRSGIEERLINMTQYFDFHPDEFNFRTDSVMLNMSLETPLFNVIQGLELEVGIGVKICVNSLYRPPFSIVRGEIDYKDLTVTAQTSHYGGHSFDISWGMSLSKYKLTQAMLIKHLEANGFTRPFLNNTPSEDWHWSYVG